MGQDRRTARALAALLPAGALGLSVSLASADAAATLASDGSAQAKKPGNGNQGHVYGTTLTATEIDDLLEFLKSQ